MKLLIRLALLLRVVALVGCGTAVPTDGGFLVRAVLVDAGGRPVAGEVLYCLLWNEGRGLVRLGMDEEKKLIVPTNPKATSDAEGRVEIVVTGDFVRRHRELTVEYSVGAYADGEPLPMKAVEKGAKGAAGGVVFDLETVRQAGNLIDLGEIVFEVRGRSP